MAKRNTRGGFIKRAVSGYVQSLLPPYKPRDFLTIGITLGILALVTTATARFMRGKASEPELVSGYYSNQILVKVKKNARIKVKETAGGDTGLASVNEIGKKAKIKTFERIAKTNRRSNVAADLFFWYALTLDTPEMLVKGYLDTAGNIVEPKSTKQEKRELSNQQNVALLRDAIHSLKQDPDIEDVDLNYAMQALLVPNDPYYSSNRTWGQAYADLWGIRKINPESAWDRTTGSASVIVADIDTGVDRNHPDIAANMWVNTSEDPTNGIDDDANGYVDDYNGWNWVSANNNPMDDHGHGTHTAGTIAAVGNNGLGVVGVTWNTKIMALKFLDSTGSGPLTSAIKALQYAADMGAKVSSNSWGCVCNSAAMDDAVAYEHNKGMVMVAAAGNNNDDALIFSPASADFAVTVAASDPSDVKASFSNWGQKIDVAAPGVDILSLKAAVSPMCTANLTVASNYCRVSGTSMATPHVAGLAALLFASDPTLASEEVRQIIRTQATDLGPSGKDANYGYGRINAGSSLNNAAHVLAPVITGPRSRTKLLGTTLSITGLVPGPNFASYTVEYGAGKAPTTWTQIANSTAQPTQNGTLATIDPTQLPEGFYIFRLTARDTGGKQFQFQVNDIELDNYDAVILAPFDMISTGTHDVIGTAMTKNGLLLSGYKLEWGAGASPATWSAAGITLTNNGTQTVASGKLGTWDTTGLTSGQTYTLRLTVASNIPYSATTTSTVKIDQDLVAGWPKFFKSLTRTTSMTPILSDLDGDGTDEYIIGLPDGNIAVYRKDGTNFPGFPVFTASGYYDWTLNVEDIDGDGKKEILATSGSGYQYAFRSDGSSFPNFPFHLYKTYENSPTVADVNGDGQKDIVVMDIQTYSDRTEATLHVFSPTGQYLPGFPKKHTLPAAGYAAGQLVPVYHNGAPAIADMDRDGIPEIAWGYSGRLYLFNSTGDVLPGWPFAPPDLNSNHMLFQSSPGFGDVYGDGTRVLFAGAGGHSCLSCATELFAFRKDGSLIPGWPKTQADGLVIMNFTQQTPALGDIDGDGKDEIAVGYQNLTIFDIEGKKNLLGPVSSMTQPALADVDGDGNVDFTAGYFNNLRVMKQNGLSYSSLFSRLSTVLNFYSPIVVADMDNNGKSELAAFASPQSVTNGVAMMAAYLWEMPNSTHGAYDWGRFGFDAAHSSRIAVVPAPLPTPTDTAPTDTPTITPDATPTGEPTLTPNATPTSPAGNPPTPTSPVGATPTPISGDTTPPQVAITKPANNSVVPRNGALQITATASDASGISRVVIWMDGVILATCNKSPCSAKPSVRDITPGSHIIRATATDKSSNANTGTAFITVVK